jgi:hypothetical protein
MPRVTPQIQITKILFFGILISSTSLWSADLKPEEVVAKHLDAIGNAQTRTGLKSRVVQGPAIYKILVGGTGSVPAKFVFANEGQKSDLLLKVNANGFMGEQFICDGSKTSVAGTYLDKSRSEFGTFVLSEDILLRENLLGGVLSSGWPLLDLEARKAKVHFEGTKKVDGKELLTLRYQPKKTTDLLIFLYFDPQTYQHVLTIYKLEPSNTLEGGETAMAGRSTRRFRIEERFSDFKTSDGLTLPHGYDLRFTFEAESGFVKSIEWEMKDLNILNNQSVDPRSFQVK